MSSSFSEFSSFQGPRFKRGEKIKTKYKTKIFIEGLGVHAYILSFVLSVLGVGN